MVEISVLNLTKPQMRILAPRLLDLDQAKVLSYVAIEVDGLTDVHFSIAEVNLMKMVVLLWATDFSTFKWTVTNILEKLLNE